MPILELEAPEGTYRNDMSGHEHFMIDCSCGGTDGRYGGSHLKGTSHFTERHVDEYRPSSRTVRNNGLEHTFFMTELLFLQDLKRDHSEKRNQSPLIIVCNDCSQEFSFTWESYLTLKDRMMREYSKKLSESHDS